MQAIRNDWDAEAKDEGSYFSKLFVGVNQFVNWFSSELVEEYLRLSKDAELRLLTIGNPKEPTIKGL